MSASSLGPTGRKSVTVSMTETLAGPRPDSMWVAGEGSPVPLKGTGEEGSAELAATRVTRVAGSVQAVRGHARHARAIGSAIHLLEHTLIQRTQRLGAELQFLHLLLHGASQREHWGSVPSPASLAHREGALVPARCQTGSPLVSPAGRVSS